MVADLEVSIFAKYGEQLLHGDEIYEGSCIWMGLGSLENGTEEIRNTYYSPVGALPTT